jgi:hypothetical protein
MGKINSVILGDFRHHPDVIKEAVRLCGHPSANNRMGNIYKLDKMRVYVLALIGKLS